MIIVSFVNFHCVPCGKKYQTAKTIMSNKYKHLFFDLDHTLWDFETNSKETLQDLYVHYELNNRGINDYDEFFKRYSYHNTRLWQRYTMGHIRQEELTWKRMWLSLLDYKIADEVLAKKMSVHFLEHLPSKTSLFPYTIELLEYPAIKNSYDSFILLSKLTRGK